jgi:hypothetical protein
MTDDADLPPPQIDEAMRRIAECKRTRGEELHIGGLSLRDIPEAVAELTWLKRFYCGLAADARKKPDWEVTKEDKESCNAVRALPARVVAALQHLEELDLRFNRIHTLPPEIGRLTALTRLGLHGNPLQVPPPDVVKKGVAAIRDYLNGLPPTPSEPPAPDPPAPETVPAQVSGGMPVGGPAERPIEIVRSRVTTRPNDLVVFHEELRDRTQALIEACGQSNATAGLKARLVKLLDLLGETPADMLGEATRVWFRLDEVREAHRLELSERGNPDRMSPEMPAHVFGAVAAFVRTANVTIKAAAALDQLDMVAVGPDERRPAQDLTKAAALAKVLADAPDVVSKPLAETLTEAVRHAGVDPDKVLPPEAGAASAQKAGTTDQADTPAALTESVAERLAKPRAEEFAGRSIVNTMLEAVRRAAIAVRDAMVSGVVTAAGWGASAVRYVTEAMVERVKRTAKLGGGLMMLGGFTGFVVNFQFIILDVAARWLPPPAHAALKMTIDNIVNILGGLFRMM